MNESWSRIRILFLIATFCAIHYRRFDPQPLIKEAIAVASRQSPSCAGAQDLSPAKAFTSLSVVLSVGPMTLLWAFAGTGLLVSTEASAAHELEKMSCTRTARCMRGHRVRNAVCVCWASSLRGSCLYVSLETLVFWTLSAVQIIRGGIRVCLPRGHTPPCATFLVDRIWVSGGWLPAS